MSTAPDPHLRLRTAIRAHWWALALAVLVVGVPTAVAAKTGNLAIPHNDSWAYSRIAQVFAMTGEFRLVGWGRMALVGQVGVLGWFGRSITAQQLVIAGLSVILLVSVYWLLVVRVGRIRALAGVFVVAIWPGYALLSTSFMTDIPALALALACLALGGFALRRDSVPLFVIAAVLGFWSVSIRDQSVAAVVALFGYAALTVTRRRRVRWAVLAVSGLVLAGITAYVYHWVDSLPNQDGSHVVLTAQTIQEAGWAALRAYLTLSWGLLPVAIAAFRPLRWRWCSFVGAAAGLAVSVAVLVHFHVSAALSGVYLSWMGAYAGVLPGNRVVIPAAIWTGVVISAVVGATVLGGELARRAALPRTELAWFTIFTALGLFGTSVLGTGIYDRYFLALVPGFLAVLLEKKALRSTSRDGLTGRIALGIPIILSGLMVTSMSAALALNAFSYDITRWRIGESLTAQGVPATSIDAGIEWMGTHSPNGVIHRSAPGVSLPQAFFVDRPTCYLLSGAATLPGYRRIEVVPYRTFLLFGHSALYVQRHESDACT